MIEDLVASLIGRISEGAVLAPLFGLLAGALLSLAPISLPSVPVVISVLAPGTVTDTGQRERPRLFAALPRVVSFVAGMDGVFGLVGIAVVAVAELLIRGAIILHLFSAALLALLGLRLLLRRTSLCDRTKKLPPVSRWPSA